MGDVLKLGLVQFEWVAALRPEVDLNDDAVDRTIRHSQRLDVDISPPGETASAFCVLRLRGLPHEPGLYLITEQRQPVYIGETVDLAERFSSRGYGRIFPSNVGPGGQSTNCNINAHIAASTSAG
jgi:hypothetical protein